MDMNMFFSKLLFSLAICALLQKILKLSVIYIWGMLFGRALISEFACIFTSFDLKTEGYILRKFVNSLFLFLKTSTSAWIPRCSPAMEVSKFVKTSLVASPANAKRECIS